MGRTPAAAHGGQAGGSGVWRVRFDGPPPDAPTVVASQSLRDPAPPGPAPQAAALWKRHVAPNERRPRLRSIPFASSISWATIEDLFTGVPVDGADISATAVPPDSTQQSFAARMTAQISRQPVRLMAACVASVLGPAAVAHAGSYGAVATAVRPAQPTATADPAPQAGEAASWMASARLAAGTCPGLPASVLVAIGQVETGLGVQPSASSAGALGPMQFLPSTWAAYGADGDGDGVADVMNPVDAVHGAARLLCANGGADPSRLASALWNYNHSDDYVRRVLNAATSVATAS